MRHLLAAIAKVAKKNTTVARLYAAVTDSVYKGTKSEAEDLEWVGDSFSTWLQ
jgi:hypothetical protein